MGAILTKIGEEFTLKNNLEGVSVDVGLYNDTTDTIVDADDLPAITTEPSDGNYARQSELLTLANNASGNWQATSNAEISFDVTGTTSTVDSYFAVVNFQSTEAGDGGANNHLFFTGALSQSRDLSQIDTLNIAVNTIGFELE